MADLARLPDPDIPIRHHGLVPTGAKRDLPVRTEQGENALLSALWSWIPRVVCLPTYPGCHRHTGVSTVEV